MTFPPAVEQLVGRIFHAPLWALSKLAGRRSFLQRTIGALGTRKHYVESEELGSILGLLSVFYIVGVDPRSLGEFLQRAPVWFTVGFIQLWAVALLLLSIARALIVWTGSREARGRITALITAWWAASSAVFFSANWRLSAAFSVAMAWQSASTYWSLRTQITDEHERNSGRERHAG